jgi:hypothetical protein
VASSSVAGRAGMESGRLDVLREIQQRHELYTADVPLASDRGGEVVAYAPLSLVPWAVLIRQSDREVFARYTRAVVASCSGGP